MWGKTAKGNEMVGNKMKVVMWAVQGRSGTVSSVSMVPRDARALRFVDTSFFTCSAFDVHQLELRERTYLTPYLGSPNCTVAWTLLEF